MTIDDVLTYYRTGYNMRKVTGLSASNVVHWKKKGYIPIVTQMKLEVLTKSALKANLKHCGINNDNI